MKVAALAAPVPTLPGVQRGLVVPDVPLAWRLDAFRGRLAELSGGPACASLALVFRLVLEAQLNAEPVVWVSRCPSLFYPPDVAECGVDLDALAVVRAPGTRRAARAADHLLRSGGFGLVVLDVGATTIACRPRPRHVWPGWPKNTTPRCSASPKKTSAAPRSARSSRCGPKWSARSARAIAFAARCVCSRTKRRGPNWTHVEVCHGPDGLC